MRPKKRRLVHSTPSARFFKPRGIPLIELEIVELKDEEWQAILLADCDRLEHETAAKKMGVSRPTFSRVLSSARRAVAKALAEGSALKIGGGDFDLVCKGRKVCMASPQDRASRCAGTKSFGDRTKLPSGS